ncbi:MAG: hypothetical protein ABI780_13925 [Ardenticatenales bacterium]
MINGFINVAIWPLAIAGVAILVAGVWRMRTRLTAAGIALCVPLFALLFIAGFGGLAMDSLLLGSAAMAYMGVRAGERVVAWGGASVVALIVGFLAWMVALSA